ncbi:CHAD domain-containing protein [Aeromonas molluscorum]|uniref:CHAD domain-containing protein n=1 Tax=Aeromonas molluscorum TaxID=271417 RepID=UPI003F1CCCB8
MDDPLRERLLGQARALINHYWAATLALRQQAGLEQVHGYRIAARRLHALLALWRPLIYHPRLERRLLNAVRRLSPLRDEQVYASHFVHHKPAGKGKGEEKEGKGGTSPADSVKVPMLAVALDEWLDAVAQVPAGFDPLAWYRLQLGLRLSLLLNQSDDEQSAKSKKLKNDKLLRQWHKVRAEIKQIRYGCELLVAMGAGDPDWLTLLGRWQEQLGQLQDGRQWYKRLRREKNTAKQQRLLRALRKKGGWQLRRLSCQRGELVGLSLLMLKVD